MVPAKAPGVRGSRGTLHASRALHFDPIKLTKSGRFAVVFQVSQRTGIQTVAQRGQRRCLHSRDRICSIGLPFSIQWPCSTGTGSDVSPQHDVNGQGLRTCAGTRC